MKSFPITKSFFNLLKYSIPTVLVSFYIYALNDQLQSTLVELEILKSQQTLLKSSINDLTDLVHQNFYQGLKSQEYNFNNFKLTLDDNAIQFQIQLFHQPPVIVNEDHGLYDVCLVAPWMGTELATYHRLMLFTANQTLDVKMLFVHENLDMTGLKPFTNIQFLNVYHIPHFVARNLCRFYKLKAFSDDCKSLTRAILRADEHVWGSALAQYRMVLGYALQEWIGPNHCNSWAYVDHDMIFGNINSFVQNNHHYWESDVVGFSSEDLPVRIFAPGQFTAHIQTKRPDYVNSLFSHCPMYANALNATNTFKGENEFYALDEGCYGVSIMKGPQIYTKFIYQTNTFNSRQYFIYINGRIINLSALEILDYQDIISKILDNKQPTQLTELVSTSLPIQISDTIKNCSHWIPTEYNLCLDETDWKRKSSKHSNYNFHLSSVQISQGQYQIVEMYSKSTKFYESAILHLNQLSKRLNMGLFNELKPNFFIDSHSGNVTSFTDIEELNHYLCEFAIIPC
ncbi:hypothetical protein HDV02_004251 [Globomyces sp. JEL0801]|nr:hypothetical protein HDV02_004251 [Globomyces sp. JEL0801]